MTVEKLCVFFFESVDLPEVAEVIDSNRVVFAVEFEQVYVLFSHWHEGSS